MKIKFLIISVLMFFGLSLTVSASADLTKKGSIEITIKEGTTMVEDAQLTIYHIADAINLKNNLAFSLRDELSGCEVNLSDLTNTNLVGEILGCDLENASKYVGSTDSNGVVKFNDLTLGLYLVKQTNEVKGYSSIDSFLVAMPKEENFVWIYDVKAKPKTDVYRVVDLVIEKKWNSHSNIIPNEVYIELYNDEELIETITLSEDNDWTYTFEKMRLSDKYSVKEINIPKGYTPSYKVNDYHFTVTNTDTLAQTGQIFYPIVMFSVLGLLLIVVGTVLIKNEA